MTPETRAQLRTQVINDEGVVLHAYQDSRGYTTIGVGTLIDPRVGGGITYAEAMMLLDNRLGIAERALRAAFPWFATLDEPRQAVLVTMAYNLGVGGVGDFRQMIAAIQRQDFAKAADEMLDSRWKDQVGLRARRLAKVMETGSWDGGGTPT